jgi:hypothetical protein
MTPRFLVVILALGVLGACSPPPAPVGQARADRQTLDACRQRADEVYERQNRGAIYTSTDNRDTPFSGSYVSGITTRGLSAEYGRGNLIADCVRSSGQNPIGPSEVQVPAPAAH